MSLRTRDKLEARTRALELDHKFEQKFWELRRTRGAPEFALATNTWTFPDWLKVVEWFLAARLNVDQSQALSNVTGSVLTAARRKATADYSPGSPFVTEMTLHMELQKLTVQEYSEKHLTRIQNLLKPIAVFLKPTTPQYFEIMAAFMVADIQAAEKALERLRGGVVYHAHPDSIEGPWRLSRTDKRNEAHAQSLAKAIAPLIGTSNNASASMDKGSKHSLEAIQKDWIVEQRRRNKRLHRNTLVEREKTILEFEQNSGVTMVEDVKRRDLIKFRESLMEKGNLKPATVNKKISYISVLVKQALSAGHIDNGIAGSLHVPVAEGEGERTSFTNEQIAIVFESEIYTALKMTDEVKAGAELQYWLPLISVTHGMISSEILQLGHDTVVYHPDDPSILCFHVTNANERRTKKEARVRYVPIRRELLDLGLREIIEQAWYKKTKSLWSIVNSRSFDTESVSSYFSGWFSKHLRGHLKIIDMDVSLYSCRHSFKDAQERLGTPDHIVSALMGHVQPGTTSKYGVKAKPRPMNIEMLDNAIQNVEWSFLGKIKKYEPKSAVQLRSPSIIDAVSDENKKWTAADLSRAQRVVLKRLTEAGRVPLRSDFSTRLEPHNGRYKAIDLGPETKESWALPRQLFKRQSNFRKRIRSALPYIQINHPAHIILNRSAGNIEFDQLAIEYEIFNASVTRALAKLGRDYECRWHVVAFQPRVDMSQNKFHLHAHIFCDIPQTQRDKALAYLEGEFLQPFIGYDKVISIEDMSCYPVKKFTGIPLEKAPIGALLALFDLPAGTRLIRLSPDLTAAAKIAEIEANKGLPEKRRRPPARGTAIKDYTGVVATIEMKQGDDKYLADVVRVRTPSES